MGKSIRTLFPVQTVYSMRLGLNFPADEKSELLKLVMQYEIKNSPWSATFERQTDNDYAMILDILTGDYTFFGEDGNVTSKKRVARNI